MQKSLQQEDSLLKTFQTKDANRSEQLHIKEESKVEEGAT